MPMSIQRLFYALIIILSTFALAYAQQPAAPAASAPRAVVPLTNYSFGDIEKGTVIAYAFAIKNLGDADLIINDFVPGCGCEVVDADRVIPPGKQGQAFIAINTTLQWQGDMLKTATLRTNDPRQPSIHLMLSANLLAGPEGAPIKSASTRVGYRVGSFFISPGLQADFTIVPDQPRHAEFNIAVEHGSPTVVRVETDSKMLTARLETVEPGKQYKVIVDTLPSTDAGMHLERVRVITDDPMLPVLPLKLRLLVRRTP